MMMNWNKLSEMKKNLLIVSAIFLISAGYFSCGKGNSEECEKLFSDNIIGRWNLIEVSVWVNRSLLDSIDYSKENIIFDFQENNKLVVSGDIPDVVVVFDDFQAGEHFYSFQTANVPNCRYAIPGPNLSIDETMLWREGRGYFCTILLSDEKTMRISKMDKVIGEVIDENSSLTGAVSYSWEKKFIKLNEL